MIIKIHKIFNLVITKYHEVSKKIIEKKEMTITQPYLMTFGAGITKYWRLGGLSNKHLFLVVLEAGKLKVKVGADLVSDVF